MADQQPVIPVDSNLWIPIKNTSVEYVYGANSLFVETVLSCVRVISESLAGLPLNLYIKSTDGHIELAENNPLYEILKYQFNEDQCSFDARYWMMADSLIYGSGYAQIFRRNGQIEGIYPLPAQDVSIIRVKEDNIPKGLSRRNINRVFYKYGDIYIDPDSMLKIDCFPQGSLTGKSLVNLASQTLGSAMSAERYAGRWFANADTPSGMLSVKGNMTDKQFSELAKTWRENYGGKKNAHSVPILPDATFQNIEKDHNAAQMIESRKFYRELIAGIFRVPAHLINDLGRASFNNIENLDEGFVKHCLRPWAVRWEQAIRKSVLATNQKNRLFARHDFSDLLRGNLSSRYSAYAQGIASGFLTRNEARASEHLNPIPGGDDLTMNSANILLRENPDNQGNNQFNKL